MPKVRGLQQHVAAQAVQARVDQVIAGEGGPLAEALAVVAADELARLIADIAQTVAPLQVPRGD